MAGARALVAAAVIGSVQAQFNIRTELCAPDPRVDATTLLHGVHLRVGLYSGELVQCTGTDAECALGQETTQAANTDPTVRTHMWEGWDAVLLENLAAIGNFTYTIVSMGRATNISQRPGGYTALSRAMLGVDALPPEMTEPIDIYGQGTWRVTASRSDWALWSDEVVSEEVLFVTKVGVKVEQSLDERMILVFQPFHWSVWVSLIVVALIAIVFFVVGADTTYGDNSAFTREEMAYNTIMTGCGHPQLDMSMHANIKGLSLAWVFFCVLMLEFYLANLTAILAQPPDYTASLSGITELRDNGDALCVQRGAANDGYFTWHPSFGDLGRGIDIKRMSSTVAQLDGVVSGECPATEITREDFSLWAESHPKEKCRVGAVGAPLTRRARGMMTSTNRSCVMVAMNSLIHAFGTRNCTLIPEVSRPRFCDLHDLGKSEFPDVECSDSISTDSDVKSLTLEETGALFILLAIMTVLAVGGTAWGQRRLHRIRKSKADAEAFKSKANAKAFAQMALPPQRQYSRDYSEPASTEPSADEFGAFKM